MTRASRASRLLALTALASLPALAADTPLGTGFSYQGQLKSSGSAVTATCDFQFSLWDALSSGSQKGATQTVTGVVVTNGLFTTTVNSGGEFGATGFAGQARWLGVAVRCPTGVGGYQGLTPRTELGVAPFAAYTQKTALVAYAQVPGSLSNAASYTAFGSPTPITVPVSGQYVIHYGGTFAAGSTSIMGGGACLTLAVDADPPSGGACLGQDTGGPTITSHDSDMVVYYIAAGAHTIQFYGTAMTSSAVSAPWFFVLRP